jgi:hypothetical protein
MHLYEINPVDLMPVHVVARSAHEAVDIFVTWSAARGRQQCTFDINRLPIESLQPFQQDQVRCAMAAGLVGIAHFDNEIGWTFSPPMWVPLGPDEQPVGSEGASP